MIKQRKCVVGKIDKSLFSINHIWLVWVAVLFRLASPATADLSFVVLAFYALFGRVQLIHALFVLWFFSMISDGIAPAANFGSIGRYLVIGVAALSSLARSQLMRGVFKVDGWGVSIVILSVYLFFHSIVISPISDVSLFKSISWCVAMFTLVVSWSVLEPAERRTLEKQIFYGLVAVMLFSVPLMGNSLGYLVNGTGFQGILIHPQAFGPTMAMLGVWLGSSCITDVKISFLKVGLFLLSLMMIVMSEARTAGLALVLGIGLAIPIGLIFRKNFGGAADRKIARKRIISSVVAVVVVLAVGGSFFVDSIGSYLTKRSESSNLLDAAEASRGDLIYKMFENIESNPVFGIGFGIASAPKLMQVERDSVFGLPTSAQVEKGVMPVAIMEELGIFGFFVVGVFFFLALKGAVRGGVSNVAVLLTALFTNFGESMFFSTGGMGLLLMILVAWSGTARTKSTLQDVKYV